MLLIYNLEPRQSQLEAQHSLRPYLGRCDGQAHLAGVVQLAVANSSLAAPEQHEN